MKRQRYLYIILIFILAFTIVSYTNPANNHPILIVDDYNGIDLDRINHYKIDVDFDPDTKSYSARQTVIYVNNTKEVLGEVYFHIYPNAYKSVETAPILFSNTTIDKKDYVPGYMEIMEVLVDKKTIDFQTKGTGGTILKLNLSDPIKPDEKMTIDFKYRVKLPLNVDRFGYGKDVFNFGNWYPIACVYDEDGWNLDPYYSIGDPFYSDTSNYDVTIRTSKDIIVATSGNIISEKTKAKEKIYTIKGKLIRDFAWVASRDFIMKEKKADETTIKVYTMEKDPDMMDFSLEVGGDSIGIFNRIFGKYPYGVYSIVMTEFPTGMEYPGIVFIGKDYFNAHSKDELEKIIVHETAHQWWYGVVGNDQIDEAWLDESLASYSEVIYMAEKYGEAEGADYYDYFYHMNYEYGKALLSTDTIINKPLNQFHSWNDYGLLVYIKGAMFLNEIKEDFGIEI